MEAKSYVEIIFPSSPNYLPLVRANVRWLCEKSGFPEKECSRVVLAIVEAVTNIIRHAYKEDPNQRIVLRLSELPDGIELELLDRGTSVTPSRVAPPSKGREQRPGGLGVNLMKTCMDHFEYEQRPGGGGRLVLRKFRKPVEAQGSKGGRER